MCPLPDFNGKDENAAGKAATQTAAATNMIFSMYITIPVILGVVITILLGLMKVEKENKRIDMERAEKAD